MRQIKILFLLLVISATAFAQEQRGPQRVPAVPHPIEWVQPSGDTIMFRLIGDENWSCRYTEDGYALVENKKGALCYAKVGCKGQLKATCIVASRPDRRTKKELRYLEKMKKNEKLYREL